MLEKYDDVLSVSDVCSILHIGKNLAYTILRNNEIPNKQIRRKYIIPKQGVIDYLQHIGQKIEKED